MRILLLLFALFGPVRPLSAQDARPPGPDARLRVTALESGSPVRVETRPASSDTAQRIESGASSRTVSVGTVGRPEVGRGRKPSVLGGVAGFLVGGAVGGVLGCLANRDDYGVFCGGQSDTKVFLGVALGGAAGGTLGALLFGRER